MSKVGLVTDPNVQLDVPKRERTRERLMDAAEQVFAESGFGGASLEVICERAGLSRGAFYYNFASKEQLLLAVMERELDSTLDLLASATTPNLQELGHVVQMVGSLYSRREHDHVTWARLTEEFRLHAMRDPEAAAAYTEQFRKIYARLGATLQDAAAVHGRRMVAPPDTIAAIVVGLFVQTVNEGVVAALDESDIQRIAIERITVVLEGLLTPA